MAFCPKCRAEFRDGFDICSDCNVSLVDELPSEQEEISLEQAMEYLGTIDDLIALKYITSLLEESKINYRLSTTATTSFLKVTYGSKQYVSKDIFVEKPRLNEAMEIVVSILGEKVEEER